MTNAERIRNMTDNELAEWLTNMCDIERHEESITLIQGKKKKFMTVMEIY